MGERSFGEAAARNGEPTTDIGKEREGQGASQRKPKGERELPERAGKGRLTCFSALSRVKVRSQPGHSKMDDEPFAAWDSLAAAPAESPAMRFRSSAAASSTGLVGVTRGAAVVGGELLGERSGGQTACMRSSGECTLESGGEGLDDWGDEDIVDAAVEDEDRDEMEERAEWPGW